MNSYGSHAIHIDFASELNQDQYAAVTAPLGPNLVLAGAGSGKTRTLTYRVAYLLSQGIQPWQILLLTFTNKAAKEMLERVEELTAVPATDFWGGTFHSIGQRIIRRHCSAIEFGSNYTILDQGEAEALMKEVVDTVDPQWKKSKELPKPKWISNIYSYSRNTCRLTADVIREKYSYAGEHAEKIQHFALAYQAAKKKRQVMDYDDLLTYWKELLEQHPDIAQRYQSRFKAILVDEYQDTNSLQSSIIDTLAQEHQIMAVGDDAQCIYTWRGADFANIMDFPQKHPQTQIHKIEINYRSSPEILHLANAILFNQEVNPGFNKELVASKPSGPRPIFIPLLDNRTQARFILSRLQELQDLGYSMGDIAILYRAHYQAMDLQLELQRAHIPFQITSGVKFFEQAHVKDITAQVRYVSNPEDIYALQRFATLLPKVGPKTATRILEAARSVSHKEGGTLIHNFSHEQVLKKVPAPAKEIWTDIAYTLQDMEDALRPPPPQKQGDLFDTPAPNHDGEIQPPATIFQMAIDGWYQDHIKSLYEDWQRRMDDLDGLINFAERYDTMDEILAQLVLLNSETSERGNENHLPQLRLTTIHQAKGLEYPVVFVIGLADEQFPIRRAIEEEDVEEERRLFYVAATRAQEQLYLTYPMMQINQGIPHRMEPSRFIRELPEDRFEVVRMA